MARIIVRQGQSGPRYTAQIRFGSHSESKTFSTKTAAKEWSKRREVELREKPHLASTEAHKRTLADALDRYARDVLPHAGRAVQQDRPRYLRWWREHYGRLTLAQFQAPQIVEARDRLALTPRRRGAGTLAPATVSQYLLALSHVLTMATKEWHWLAASPMDGVRMPKLDNRRTRFLDDTGDRSELVRLLEACRISESEHLYPAVLLALTTGGRAQEVLGLQWRHVDLSAATVTFADTKNGTTRTVAITPEAVALLKARQGIGRALVFPGRPDPEGKRPPHPVDLTSAWKTALRRAGVEGFRWHDLRHTAASYAAMEGATLAEIAAVLGHKTLAMVGRYSHLSPDHVAKASARIGARIRTSTEGR